MSRFPFYKNQALPDRLTEKATEFLDVDDLINNLKKAIKTKETIYTYCSSVDQKTGEMELQFMENTDITGYMLLEDISYDKIHVGRAVAHVDSIVGVKIIEVEENDGIIKVKCSRKEVVKDIHDIYNKDVSKGTLKEGMMLKGIVDGMDHNKVYIDIGGDVTAILGVADISKAYVREPSEIIKHGEVIDLVVKKVYADPLKVSLSRAMLMDGWESIDKKFKVGKIVPGTIKNRMATGIFIALDESFEGLAEDIPRGVHYNYGDRVKVSILSIDKKRQKIRLRIIQNR